MKNVAVELRANESAGYRDRIWLDHRGHQPRDHRRGNLGTTLSAKFTTIDTSLK